MRNFVVSIISLAALFMINTAVCDDHLTHDEVNRDKQELKAASTTLTNEKFSCAQVYSSAQSLLSLIELKLHAVASKEDYQQSLKERFVVLNSLESDIQSCNAKDKPELAYKLKKVSSAIQMLKNNSQASAFTSFKNWVESKEKDLSACAKAF